MVTYLSVIGILVDGPEGARGSVLFGQVAGCHSGPLLWPCVLSKLHPVAAAGLMLWRRGSFVVLVREEVLWLLCCNWDIFNVVHGRCWCPLYHIITLGRHCVCRIASFFVSSVEL